jgi:hypothetical protein
MAAAAGGEVLCHGRTCSGHLDRDGTAVPA